jgi:YegS/Rv2252/BmrU family lipid kinase
MKNENRKVLFIINKFSGTGYKPEVEGRIIKTCSALGYECLIEFTSGRGHAIALAKQAVTENIDLVFAVGGDGTVNEVAQGLVNSSVTMGILPKGSGNGLARHLGIPTSFKKSVNIIGSHEYIMMDTLLINNNLSVNVSGIGFDGHIAALFGQNGKRGLINYTRLVMKEFGRFKEFESELTIDGKKFHRRSFMIAFANSSQFGNNALVAPHASVCDQLIDISFVKKIPWSSAVGFAHKIFSGNLGQSKLVEMVKGETIHAHFSEPIAWHLDGEAFPPAQSFEIKIVPSSLKMLIPAIQKGKV